MRRLSLITLVLLVIVLAAFRAEDSPHGDDLKLNCDFCHSADSWKFMKNSPFSHNTTSYPLLGQHQSTDCRKCHPTLIFSEAGTECVSCHTDMHSQTVGMECGRCHTPQSWIVNNIVEIHLLSRFPLYGPHMTAQCIDCHVSASMLYFEPLGIECVDCHMDDYASTTDPNHNSAGFSTDCLECHLMNSISWGGAGINHNFFPLTKGHDLSDCSQCHLEADYSIISAACFSCHETDYATSNNPSHQIAEFSTSCEQCHTTDPGWSPANFVAHDGLYFPVYSGGHVGVWDNCTECHADPSNYTIYSCTICHDHDQSNMDDEHSDITGYIYESSACLSCHPTGSAEEGFDHNLSNFPLTGAHIVTTCADCHTSSYAGTPTDCYACHEPDYEGSLNPGHTVLGFSTDCTQCHTTNEGWSPASFIEHDGLYFPVYSGKHVGTWSDCSECHTDPSNYAINSCTICHDHNQQDMDNKHEGISGYIYESSACLSCHPTGSAEEGFDHNQSNFPLTGAHTVTACADCHTSGYAGTPTDCYSCHEQDYQGSQNPGHSGLGLSTDCTICHTTNQGWSPASFNNHNDYYALIGAHSAIANDCNACHSGNYNTTPNTCVGCHQDDYNQTNDPSHIAAQFPTDCELCHNQNAWEPSTFNHDGLYFPIYSGKHNGEWSACIDCHTIPSNYSLFSCIDCHEHNQSEMDNKHSDVSGYVYNSIACFECHPDGQSMRNLKIRQQQTPGRDRK